ncbi:hypothetical protein [Micromonospora rubida]
MDGDACEYVEDLVPDHLVVGAALAELPDAQRIANLFTGGMRFPGRGGRCGARLFAEQADCEFSTKVIRGGLPTSNGSDSVRSGRVSSSP